MQYVSILVVLIFRHVPDEAATEDLNGLLCAYPDEYYDCDGNCLNDTDDDGICDELEILGCLNPDALNYNPKAIEESGICILTGCTDLEACNYDEFATEDFEGLLCVYPDFGYDCNGNCILLEGCELLAVQMKPHVIMMN